MNHWMKSVKNLIAMLTFLFSAVSLFANDSCCSNEAAWMDSCSHKPYISCDFAFGIDFLWWKPVIDDLDYGAESVTATHIKIKHICPEWEPGIRVKFSKPNIFCDWALNVSGSYIQSIDSDSVSRNDGIISSLLILNEPPEAFEGFFDSANGKWESDYFEWDALFAYNISFGPCHDFNPFFGVTGLVLDQELKGKYIDLDEANAVVFEADGKWSSDYWGVGLKAGTTYSYDFYNCSRFFFLFSSSVLVGQFDSKLDSTLISAATQSTTKLKLEDNNRCHLVTGYHVGIGYNFEKCFCNKILTFGVGYEIVDWFEIPNQENFAGNPDTTHYHGSSSSTRALGFHGVYAGLSLNY